MPGVDAACAPFRLRPGSAESWSIRDAPPDCAASEACARVSPAAIAFGADGATLTTSQEPCFRTDGSNARECCGPAGCSSWLGARMATRACVDGGTLRIEATASGAERFRLGPAGAMVDAVPDGTRHTYTFEVDGSGWLTVRVDDGPTSRARGPMPGASAAFEAVPANGTAPSIVARVLPPGIMLERSASDVRVPAGEVRARGKLAFSNTLASVHDTVAPLRRGACDPCAHVDDADLPVGAVFAPKDARLEFAPPGFLTVHDVSFEPTVANVRRMRSLLGAPPESFYAALAARGAVSAGSAVPVSAALGFTVHFDVSPGWMVPVQGRYDTQDAALVAAAQLAEAADAEFVAFDLADNTTFLVPGERAPSGIANVENVTLIVVTTPGAMRALTVSQAVAAFAAAPEAPSFVRRATGDVLVFSSQALRPAPSTDPSNAVRVLSMTALIVSCATLVVVGVLLFACFASKKRRTSDVEARLVVPQPTPPPSPVAASAAPAGEREPRATPRVYGAPHRSASREKRGARRIGAPEIRMVYS